MVMAAGSESLYNSFSHELSMLTQAVSGGTVVGVDSSRQMLAAAHRKIDAGGGGGGILRCVDATAMGPLRHEEPALFGGADGVLFTYSPSLMRPWRQAWSRR